MFLNELYWWIFRGECDLRNERAEGMYQCCLKNKGCCRPDHKLFLEDCVGKYGDSPWLDCYPTCLNLSEAGGPSGYIFIDPNHPNLPIEPGESPNVPPEGGPPSWD